MLPYQAYEIIRKAGIKRYDAWQKIIVACEKGTGLRLNADEVRKLAEEALANDREAYPTVACPECEGKIEPQKTKKGVLYACEGWKVCEECGHEEDCKFVLEAPPCFGLFAPSCESKQLACQVCRTCRACS